MNRQRRFVTLLLTGACLWALPAQARVLDLQEIYEMEQYLDCATNTCGFFCEQVWEEPQEAHYLQFVACETCLEDQGCGEALRIWEKDGVEPITREDHDRAILEQQFPDEICYADADNTIVLPRELCGGALCEGLVSACLDDYDEACVETGEEEQPNVDCDAQGHCWFAKAPTTFSCPDFLCTADAPTFASFNAALLCVDTDADGLPSWVEQSLEGADSLPCEPGAGDCPDGWTCAEAEFDAWRCQMRPCGYDQPCSFRESCEEVEGVAVPICQSRGVCSGGGSAVSAIPSEKDAPVGEICDPETGACLDCIYHAHCADGERCTLSGQCVEAKSCSNSLDCVGDPANPQVCDADEGYCVDCVSDAECDGSAGEVCGPEATCIVSCDSDLDCVDAGQLCSFTEEGAGHCAQCAGDEGCTYEETCVRGTCQPRKCSDGDLCLFQPTDEVAAEAVCPELNCNANLYGENPSCTAFHLEKVAEDDTEVLIQVHYDHTPIPARVLDLYLTYDDTQLLLQDARPLKPLELKGKKLASSHLSDGTLVLNVYDDDGTHPIPKGPIVELVFRRVGVCPTEIGFATDRYDLLPMSVAPLQGSDELQDTLADPDLWGAPIRLCARSTIPTRLRLSYAYESLDSPLEYANVPSAEEICERVPACVNEPDPVIQARMISRLDAMQRGDVLATESIPGVAGNAAYLDGAADHLTLPVHYDTPLVAESQSFSVSTWFYGEGNSANENATTPQVLYSHNAYNERTSFGLMSVDAVGSDRLQLAFFLGDLLDTDLSGDAVLANAEPLPNGKCATTNFLASASAFWIDTEIPLRTWHHVAFNFNAETRVFDLFLDGERAGCIEVQDLPISSQCPQLHAATDVTVHDEGDVLGGRSPEYLWLGVRVGGLNKVQRMDPAGLQSETIIGDSEYNYQDPHYSPVLDRVVYSSDVTGSAEIWIAHGDGSNRKQVTQGFGDAGRGISARRPRFAPDGSAIVFDSNVFDVVKKDNHYARVRHIYYVAYDPETNEVAVELPDNSSVDHLAYEERLADGTIEDYRLTDTLDRHHKAARWLTGVDETAIGRELGALLIDTSKDDMSEHRVYLLTIPTAYPLSSIEPVPGLGEADEVRLLDAYHAVKAAYPSPILTERAILTRENLLWEADGDSADGGSAQFSLQCKNNAGALVACTGQGSTEVVISHVPVDYVEPAVAGATACVTDADCNADAFELCRSDACRVVKCWDKNFNNQKDDEDLNGDGVLDEGDCYPPTLDIYLTYDYERFDPVLDVVQRCGEDSDCDGGQVCGQGDQHYANNPATGFKRCEIADRSTVVSCGTCTAGYVCEASTCVAQAPAPLGCLTQADCVGTGLSNYLCDNNICKPPGTQPKLCLDDTDCSGTNVCAGGYCATTATPSSCASDSDCAGTQVCSPIEPQGCVQPDVKTCQAQSDCGSKESCQGNECVLLGKKTALGAISLTKSCVLDVDCGGGEICSADGLCQEVTGVKSCDTSSQCTGGEVCNTDVSLCRPAGDPKTLCSQSCTPSVTVICPDCVESEGKTCDVLGSTVALTCAGGEVCNVSTKTCRPAVGERLMSEPGDAIDQWVGGKKDLEITSRFGEINGAQRALVRLEVRSPLSADPIPAGALVTVRFEEKEATAFAPQTPAIYRPRIHSETGIKDLTSPAPPVLMEPGEVFEQITGGAFSPDGERLMLGTITDARPHLLRTQTLDDSLQVAGGLSYYSVSEAERVTTSPLSISGIEWVRQSRYYPCNWVGAYLHFQSKAYMYGFRGGVEDTRVYSGLRDADAIRSEAERGREFLVKMDMDGTLDSMLPSCGNSHLECPPYHLCIESECQMRACDPADPWSCADVGGRCTLRPISVEQENTGPGGSTQTFDWVCSADCNNDNQCFTQVCLNGPCRFCDASLTCIECRESTTQLGELTISGTEGCPDQRSFACDSGACVTNCYAFEDGESIYLCDETTEYCDRGQCVLLDWDWGDLAPATMAGAGDMRLKMPPQPQKGWGGVTEAVDQRVPITIQAYGNEDWTHSPEVVIEVKGGVFYGADWNRIAKIPITNRTAVEAQNNPYVVTSSFLFEDLRMRMVTSPLANSHGGATGLGENDKHFCMADKLAAGKTETEAKILCAHRPSSSRAHLGYPIQVSTRQQIDYCNEQGHSGCSYVKQSEHDFLLPGSRGVVVMDVNVDGAGVMNNITQNMVCHYEGGGGALAPKDGGVDSKVVYGRLGEELSNEAVGLLAACSPSLAPGDHTAIWTGDGEPGESASASASAGTGHSLITSGVAHGLQHAAGQVGGALSFDAPSDHLSVPTEVLGEGAEFSMEGWIRTGDLSGGLLSIVSRPKTCKEWKERGRVLDGQYALWVNERYVPVHCAGMSDPAVEPKSYLDLNSQDPEANTSIYRAGGGSFGSTVETAYSKVGFDPEAMLLDLSDTTFTTGNGGHLGHGCKPTDPSDPTKSGCFLKDGGLVHLWRGDGDAKDTIDGQGPNHGISFAPGRIGEAMYFGAAGAYVASTLGLPDFTDELTVEGWIRVDDTTGDQVIARVGDFTSARFVVRGPTVGSLGDCVEGGGAPLPDAFCDEPVVDGKVCCEIAWMKAHQGAWELALESNMLRFQVVGATQKDDGEVALVRGTTEPLESNQWYHVAATLAVNPDGDHVATLLVNGESVAEELWDVTLLMAHKPVVLGQGALGRDAYQGLMDDLGVWTTGLTSLELQTLYALGQPGTQKAGDGNGKCLLEEVQALVTCEEGDIVTQLPLGVAYGCQGENVDTTVVLDIAGTPVRFPPNITSSFKKASEGAHDPGSLGLVSFNPASPQSLTLLGGGSCDGTGPVTWAGDPTLSPVPAGITLPVTLLGESVVESLWCGDTDACLARTFDELLVVALDPAGLRVRSRNEGAGHSATLVPHGASDINDFGWHHLAVVRGSSHLRIYVDGQEIFFDHTVPLIQAADLEGVDRVLIGQEGHCAREGSDCTDYASAFAGRLDELAFYDRELLASEVTTLSNEGRRGRPVPGRPNPTCPDQESGLVAFDTQAEGLALLNCDFVDSDPTGDSAGVLFQNVIVERILPAESASVTYDTGDVCLIEETPNLTVPCFGWIGGDASLDPYNDLIDFGSYVPFQTLEVSLPRSFGHDEGFEGIPLPKYPLKVSINFTDDAEDQTVVLDWEPRNIDNGPLGPGNHPLHALQADRGYDVRIVTAPPGYHCNFKDALSTGGQICGTCAAGTMTNAGATLQVQCMPIRSLSVNVDFIDADGVALSATPVLIDDLVIDAQVSNTSPAKITDSARLLLGATSAPPLGSDASANYVFQGLEAIDGQVADLQVVSSPGGFSCEWVTATPSATELTTDVFNGDKTVGLLCQADPTHGLKVSVSSLADASGLMSCGAGSDTGLVVRLVGTDGKGAQGPETICVDSDGVYNSASLKLLVGGSWTAEIVSQPNPTLPERRRCAFAADPSGMVLPGGGGTTIAITCESPTVEVKGDATGLYYDTTVQLHVTSGASAGLTEQLVLVAPPVAQVPDIVAYSFDTLLFGDEGFEILPAVVDPDLECTFPPPWEGLIELPLGITFPVTCNKKPEPVYNLGGVVMGLEADGLKLQAQAGAITMNIDHADGAVVPFTVEFSYTENSDYDVGIKEQPTGQFCKVINSSGTFGKENVSNVIVFCQNLTTVQVELTAPGGYGAAMVKASLIKVDSGAYLAGKVEPDDVSSAGGGSFSFSMTGDVLTDSQEDQDPGATEPPTPPLTSGEYLLTVWLTTKTSAATGAGLFKPGESLAATRTLWINTPLPKVLPVVLTANEFKTTVGGPVTIYPKTPLAVLEKGQQIACAWSPWNAAAPVPPFQPVKGDTELTKLLPPILGYSHFKCEDANGCKIVTQQEFLDYILDLIESGEDPDPSAPLMVGAVGHTSEDYPLANEDALPAGISVDLTCWADSKDSELGGVVDDGGTGILSLGDSYGRLEDVTSGNAVDITLYKFTD